MAQTGFRKNQRALAVEKDNSTNTTQGNRFNHPNHHHPYLFRSDGLWFFGLFILLLVLVMCPL